MCPSPHVVTITDSGLAVSGLIHASMCIVSLIVPGFSIRHVNSRMEGYPTEVHKS